MESRPCWDDDDDDDDDDGDDDGAGGGGDDDDHDVKNTVMTMYDQQTHAEIIFSFIFWCVSHWLGAKRSNNMESEWIFKNVL